LFRLSAAAPLFSAGGGVYPEDREEYAAIVYPSLGSREVGGVSVVRDPPHRLLDAARRGFYRNAEYSAGSARDNALAFRGLNK